MMDALIEAGERIKADDSIRVVVISAEGKAFCAGLDMGNFAKMAEGGDAGVTDGGGRQLLADRTHGLTNRPQQVAYTWREIKVPSRGGAGFCVGWRLSNLYGRRYALCRAGHEIFHHGKSLGAGTGYGHNPCDDAAGPRGYRKRAGHDGSYFRG